MFMNLFGLQPAICQQGWHVVMFCDVNAVMTPPPTSSLINCVPAIAVDEARCSQL